MSGFFDWLGSLFGLQSGDGDPGHIKHVPPPPSTAPRRWIEDRFLDGEALAYIAAHKDEPVAIIGRWLSEHYATWFDENEIIWDHFERIRRLSI